MLGKKFDAKWYFEAPQDLNDGGPAAAHSAKIIAAFIHKGH